MPDQHWDNLKQIFHAAVALPPGSVLGEGRMGKVYLAHDTKLDRKVVEDSAAGFSSQSGEHEALYAGS